MEGMDVVLPEKVSERYTQVIILFAMTTSLLIQNILLSMVIL